MARGRSANLREIAGILVQIRGWRASLAGRSQRPRRFVWNRVEDAPLLPIPQSRLSGGAPQAWQGSGPSISFEGPLSFCRG
jgi:hypothetical protein